MEIKGILYMKKGAENHSKKGEREKVQQAKIFENHQPSHNDEKSDYI